LRLKILKKLKTASLNSEYTGSYKKKCIAINESFRIVCASSTIVNQT